MNHNNAAVRVLRVPELLDMVIGDADRDTITKTARVCREWSAIALAHLWHTQTALEPLFSLLTSQGFQLQDNKLGLKGCPSEHNWRRFFEYSRRIKALIIDDRAERHTPLLDTFARLRPFHIGQNGNLFPALRTLHWTAATETSLLYSSVLFMHPGIRTFHVDLPQTYAHTRPGNALDQYIDHAIGRMPNIEHLAVKMRGYWAVVEPNVVRLIKGFSKTLVSLELPTYWTSTALLETLSALPHFRELKRSESVYGVYDPARRFAPRIPATVASWPCLEALTLAVPFGEVTRFLRTCYLPPSLVDLELFTPRLETRESIRDLCLAISEKCPAVHTLTINKCPIRPLDQHLLPALHICPSIDDILPVLSLPLVSFSFRHEFPLYFPEKRLRRIVKNLPDIEVLDLNPNPDYDPAAYSKGDFLSLGSLTTFLKYCPELEELTLYIDNKNTDFYDAGEFKPTYEQYEFFEELCGLTLGGPGPIELFGNQVLFFLSRYIALGCEVVSATEARRMGITEAVALEREEFWKCVNERLPMLVAVRLDEEEKRAVYFDALMERAQAEILRCGGNVSVLDDPEDSDDSEDEDRSVRTRTPPPAYQELPPCTFGSV